MSLISNIIDVPLLKYFIEYHVTSAGVNLELIPEPLALCYGMGAAMCWHTRKYAHT